MRRQLMVIPRMIKEKERDIYALICIALSISRRDVSRWIRRLINVVSARVSFRGVASLNVLSFRSLVRYPPIECEQLVSRSWRDLLRVSRLGNDIFAESSALHRDAFFYTGYSRVSRWSWKCVRCKRHLYTTVSALVPFYRWLIVRRDLTLLRAYRDMIFMLMDCFTVPSGTSNCTICMYSCPRNSISRYPLFLRKSSSLWRAISRRNDG